MAPGIRGGQRRNRILALTVDPQGAAAGGQHAEPGGCGQQLSDARRGVAHLLEVVENDEHPSLAHVIVQGGHGREAATVREAELVGDGAGNQLGISQGRERHEEDAVRESSRQPCADLE